MKKFLALILSITIVTAVFTACGQKTSDPENASGQNEENKIYNIGIAQFAQHGSLDNCREGFIQGLAEEGFIEDQNIKLNYQNAQADMGIINQVAESMASGDNDLICAIATPMAQAAYNAANEKGIPVIYTAVTDPIAANLSGEQGLSNGNATGTSDKLPVEEQLKVIRAFMPDAKNIGILYCTSEINSESAIAKYKELAGNYGFTIVESGISEAADIPLAMDNIVTKVDCMTNLTDNTVVNSLSIVLEKANAKNIPVFGSEIEQVKNGCVAAAGLNYIELGKQTGRMAARILNGESAGNIPFETISGSNLYINSKALESIGLKCPEELADTAIEASEQ